MRVNTKERREGRQNERTAREVSWCFREPMSGHAEEDKSTEETGDKTQMGKKKRKKKKSWGIGVTRGARRKKKWR